MDKTTKCIIGGAALLNGLLIGYIQIKYHISVQVRGGSATTEIKEEAVVKKEAVENIKKEAEIEKDGVENIKKEAEIKKDGQDN
ncbi:hypothetical protein DEO72_LG8g36 [Vigna unguiculata]|uniref:Uncharacterized protein n=1 Tax=Vigna unguiculata TaxID=3917 RepID=A0A4D6MKX3_VIGUN|nr:hypothetical protein DEO72_LG8g34 [Vigna unguiculata]QCE02024.1 hypothetical protein DEO72_LG8g35 [Vigna unguiculata]QCE02025.1 hypothetical protein DEO72_LG8g36 [Vigna unguiculata]